jgi:Fur family peroxide stress response transcriptional regulator
LTLQRRIVLEAVAGREDHPPADRIYDEVRRTHSEVSRATIYRTLEKFVELGVLRKVCHPGSVVRYDPRVGRHHHLVCLRCTRMEDYTDPRLDDIGLPPASRQGFHITDYSIQFRGVCRECRKKEGQPVPGRRVRRKRKDGASDVKDRWHKGTVAGRRS